MSQTSDLDRLDLNIIVMLAEGDTLTSVGRQVGLSPSALSHRLSRLSQRLGFPVTEIEGRRVQLTDRMLRAVPFLKAGWENLALADAVMREPEGTAHVVGIARILAGWAENFLPIEENGHSVRWAIQTGTSEDIADKVRRGRIEAGIVRTDHGFPGVHWRVLSQDPLLAVATPDLAKRLPDAIDRWPWIGFSHGLGHGRTVDRVFAEIGMQRVTEFVVDALESALGLVVLGRGVAVLPYFLVADQMRDGRLVEAAVAGVVWPSRTVAILSPTGFSESSWIGRWGQRIARHSNHGKPSGHG